MFRVLAGDEGVKSGLDASGPSRSFLLILPCEYFMSPPPPPSPFHHEDHNYQGETHVKYYFTVPDCQEDYKPIKLNKLGRHLSWQQVTHTALCNLSLNVEEN